MRKLFTLLTFGILLAATPLMADDYQIPNSDFEDWSGTEFNGNIQPATWHGSNVSQMGQNVNFTTRETGHSGSYATKVADTWVGAFGIGSNAPGYLTLGTPWQYLGSLSTSNATAGTEGGMAFTHRPDSMVVWIKREGTNTGDENFNLLYYAWSGTAVGSSYLSAGGDCLATDRTDEESDIRTALDKNACSITTQGHQIAEGWFYEKKSYSSWTRMSIPIYYLNSDVPAKCNIIFSAGNYPNFRAAEPSDNNTLIVDDVQLIYSSKIQQLLFDNKEWKGFDPNSSEEQIYSLGESVTTMPKIEARRGVGSLTNSKGTTAQFVGRVLSGSEISITEGTIGGDPTVITVKAEDGSSTTTYKIKFIRAASTNTKVANITVNGEAISGFNPSITAYTVELPYGTTEVPVVAAEKQEDDQQMTITQATSLTGQATIKVVAADKKSTSTYTISFKVGQLKDNTLQDILVNGESLPGFVPTQTIYKVSLPLGTTTMPTVVAVSAYPEGAQTIVYTVPTVIDGGTYQISVTTPGNQTPKNYKLNFKLEASTYSKLKSLSMVGPVDPLNPTETKDYLADFDPSVTTYYVNLPLGTTSLPEITYVTGDSYQTVTINEGGLDGVTSVIVTAASGAQTIYRINVTTLKSDNSALAGIKIGGVDLEGFSPSTLKYTVNLAEGTTEIPTIEAVAGDPYQTITITYGGLNETSRIAVVAGDGSVTNYQILFSVAKSQNTKLADILVGGVSLPGYDPDTLEYTYILGKDDAFPEVKAVKSETSQVVNERKITAAPGDYKLTVVAESGDKRTYIIHFALNLSSNASLAAILLDGTPMAGFDANTLNYVDSLPAGQSVVPEVSYQKAENGQKVIVSEADNTYTLAVTAEDGVTTKAYTVQFIIQKSENAFLNDILLDGVSIPGFQRDVLSYEYTLTSSVVPTITVEKADQGQQVSISAPVGAGKATILVVPESGATNTYVIEFKKAATAAVELDNILVDGVQIDGWNPATMTYTVQYAKDQPAVTYEAKAGQTVQTITNGNTVSLYVTADGETAVYTINFVQKLSTNALLAGIYLDDVLIDGFDPSVSNYTSTVPVGQATPTITWKKNDAAQSVVFGQISANVYQLNVLAADGVTRATYTVNLPAEQYGDASLIDIFLDGVSVIADFDATNVLNGRSVPEGSVLPTITYTKRDGQTVLISDLSATQQQITVVAETGATATYTINYTLTKGVDASLSNILVDGVAIAGFDPTVHEYTYTLNERTAQVPAVTPQSNIKGQTYNITYGRVDARTTIEVIARDGATKSYYYIDFPVRKLTNSYLASLTLSDGATLMTDPKVLEYTYECDPAAIPTVEYTKAEEEQQIEYTLGQDGETWIKVTAQSGASTTYHVTFQKQSPGAENVLASLKVNNQDIDLTTGNDVFNVTLPYGTTTLPISYEKNFESQTVLFYNGGVSQPSTIIVVANANGMADKTYTIVPAVETFAKAGKLETLKFNGTEVPGFQPDIYNYVVNVTAQPSASDFTGTAYEGKTVTVSTLDTKKKMVTLTVADGETYTVCYFYENDKDPFDFSGTWVSAANNGATKPSNDWKVIADYSAGITYKIASYPIPYTTGMEVMQSGANGVTLATNRQGAIRCSVPGMMTLGSMTVNFKTGSLLACNATSSVSKTASDGITYRNTPESLEFQYNCLYHNSIDNWKIWVTISDGSTMKESTYTGSYSTTSQVLNGSLALSYPTTVSNKLNATLNSCSTENCGDMGGLNDNQNASLALQNMHLYFNSIIASATVDGNAATVNNTDHTITYAYSNAEQIAFPQLKVVGQVHDQEQSVTWADEKLVGSNMVRTGILRNYGEDHSYTDYTVTISRPAVSDLNVGMTFGEESLSGKANYTVYREGAMASIPNLVVTPNSVHQSVSVAREGDVISVTVRNEMGGEQVYTITYANPSDDEARLASINVGATVLSGFSADKFDYELSETSIPTNLGFTKRNEFQTVAMTLTDTVATFVVTASDKTATKTYNVTLAPKTTSGNLVNLRLDGKSRMAEARMEVKDMPEVVLFERQDATDKITETITSDSVVIEVVGSVTNKYVIVDTQSADNDANLGGILLAQKAYKDFDPAETDVVIPTDSVLDIEFVAANQDQKLTISMPSPRHFTVVVLAADQVTTKTYNISFEKPQSSDATLSAIRVDGTPIADFYASKLDYVVTLPVGSPKTSLPSMADVEYIPTDATAKVKVESAGLNGTNYITVTAPDGSAEKQYSLTVEAAKSSYALLDGIVIDGTPIDEFESSRFFYSAQVESGVTHTVEVSSPDKYITTRVVEQQGRAFITVTAEDGAHTQTYVVEFYEASKSNNVTLSDLLVSGVSISGFEPMNNTYSYELAPSATNVPDIQAVPMVADQKITIRKSGWDMYVDVVAPDGVSHNTYTIHFIRPLSTNALLKMISLDGDSLAGFQPEQFIYQVELPVGVHTLPEIYAQRGENLQQNPVIKITDLKAEITTTAQDGTTHQVYTILFTNTYSSADTLLAVYADNQAIATFSPHQFYYNEVLPIETVNFPELTWQEADEWQTITLDTLELNDQSMMCQIQVVAENGRKNLYTISYTRQLWDVDTIQSIKINGIPLADFDAHTFEYSYILPAGTEELPVVSYDTEDKYKQTITIVEGVDTIATKSINKKVVIIVKAENGNQNSYTIHFPIAVSDNSALKDIFYGGVEVPNFYPDMFAYSIQLPEGQTSVPLITWEKEEDAQNVKLTSDSLHVELQVLAEDKKSTSTYTIDFFTAPSSNALLSDILLSNGLSVDFNPMMFEYEVLIPYNADSTQMVLPAITPVKSDERQQVEVSDPILQTSGDQSVSIVVTAEDEETQSEYVLVFTFAKNNDALLKDILVSGTSLPGFVPDSTEFTIAYPVGSDSTVFVSADEISYVLSDPLATVYKNTEDNGSIVLIVTAQDGVSNHAYILHQTIALDSINSLSMIYLDGKEMPEFDADNLDYTYYLRDGMAPPALTAEAFSEYAEVSIKAAAAGDTALIICTSQAGEDRIYRICFAISEMGTDEASAGSVMFHHVSGTNQYNIATTHQGVQVCVYDMYGHLFYINKQITPADPNDVRTYVNADGKVCIADVNPASCDVIELPRNMVFFYTFFSPSGKILESGKVLGMY